MKWLCKIGKHGTILGRVFGRGSTSYWTICTKCGVTYRVK